MAIFHLNPIMLKSQTGQFIVDTLEEFLRHTDITNVPSDCVDKITFILKENKQAKDNLIKSL